MKKFVLDASVVLNFLLEEKSSADARFKEVLNRVKSKKGEFIAPYLLPLEVGNGLRYTLTDKGLARECLVKFLALPISFFTFKIPHYSRILKLAYSLNTSFYDTSYHFLALFLGGVFLTGDKEYFEKAKKLGCIELV